MFCPEIQLKPHNFVEISIITNLKVIMSNSWRIMTNVTWSCQSPDKRGRWLEDPGRLRSSRRVPWHRRSTPSTSSTRSSNPWPQTRPWRTKKIEYFRCLKVVLCYTFLFSLVLFCLEIIYYNKLSNLLFYIMCRHLKGKFFSW